MQCHETQSWPSKTEGRLEPRFRFCSLLHKNRGFGFNFGYRNNTMGYLLHYYIRLGCAISF